MYFDTGVLKPGATRGFLKGIIQMVVNPVVIKPSRVSMRKKKAIWAVGMRLREEVVFQCFSFNFGYTIFGLGDGSIQLWRAVNTCFPIAGNWKSHLMTEID